MSSCRFSMDSVPLGQVCFISLIFFPAFVLPLYPSLFLLFFSFPISLCTDTLSLARIQSHIILGLLQDKSIWSIQGSGCHFIHIFSSLVTLLKATASIYPEWMNEPTDETQEKMRPTQPEMTTANQPVTFKHVLKFCVLYTIKNSLVISEAFGTMFSIHLWMRRQRAACPSSSDKRMAIESSSLGEKWDVTVSGGTEQRKLETRQKCVCSCQLVSWPSSRLPLPSVRRGN